MPARATRPIRQPTPRNNRSRCHLGSSTAAWLHDGPSSGSPMRDHHGPSGGVRVGSGDRRVASLRPTRRAPGLAATRRRGEPSIRALRTRLGRECRSSRCRQASTSSHRAWLLLRSVPESSPCRPERQSSAHLSSTEQSPHFVAFGRRIQRRSGNQRQRVIEHPDQLTVPALDLAVDAYRFNSAGAARAAALLTGDNGPDDEPTGAAEALAI